MHYESSRSVYWLPVISVVESAGGKEKVGGAARNRNEECGITMGLLMGGLKGKLTEVGGTS